tara:strand:- start:3621 stop:4517 length:897 start_codon:yes stop_codon:yes gene_type:complete
MDISIVIVNYNVKEYIISCIQSIYKHSKSSINFEIIVVDNNSRDDSVSKLKKEFPKINLIENDFNYGFSLAANQGAKICTGEFLLILNPDTLFVEDSLNKLYEYAKNKNKLGAIGPAIISEDGSFQQSFWRDPSIINTFFSITHLDYFNFKKNYKNRKISNPTKVDTISGGVFFLKRKVFRKLGGFNGDLFWMEDIDFCVRLRRLGYSVNYFPLTKIIHFIGKSVETNYQVAITNQLISKIKYFKIHHSRLSSGIISFLILFVCLVKLSILTILIPFSSLYRKKFVAYLYTFRRVVFK